MLHAVLAGSLYPDRSTHPEAAEILRSNRHVVRALNAKPDGQLLLFSDLRPFTLYPDVDRIQRVVVKNARGHACHEIAEPLLTAPAHVHILPLSQMSDDQRTAFDSPETGPDIWPEVGSRMMVHLVNGGVTAGGWIVVEHDRYRYAIDWSHGVTVRTVIWEYLATETRWDC